MGKLKVVTIDGPSGAGKSTTARLLAKKLGWNCLDTGAMYRAVGLKAHRNGIPLDDDARLEKLLAGTKISFSNCDGAARIFLDGEDVSEAIREHYVSSLASRVSARRPVREAMARFQREIGSSNPTIAEGRDMGTVVFNDAFLKIFLKTSPETRARRRTNELVMAGTAPDYEAILADITERDHNDSTRALAPLKPAEDAVMIDSGALNADEVVEAIAALVEERES
ncbi:MAG: (d)CMP kinase [Deltaproteobacteria bacterium]|nr:MAG: (d)CMP kinase [Deltaproteobacteria bacterium]